jgi:hypothetical protein
LSEEQAGKGLSLKDLEKLSKMVCAAQPCSPCSPCARCDSLWLALQVNKVCLSVKKAVGRKAKEGLKKGGKGALHEGDELDQDYNDDGGGDYDY